MPIQNIDNYLMPSRSQEASIQKSHGDNRIPLEQQALTSEMENRTERNLKRTTEAEKTESKEQGFDAKKKGNNEYIIRKSQRKKKEEKSLNSKKGRMSFEGRTIDIKL